MAPAIIGTSNPRRHGTEAVGSFGAAARRRVSAAALASLIANDQRRQGATVPMARRMVRVMAVSIGQGRGAVPEICGSGLVLLSMGWCQPTAPGGICSLYSMLNSPPTATARSWSSFAPGSPSAGRQDDQGKSSAICRATPGSDRPR